MLSEISCAFPTKIEFEAKRLFPSTETPTALLSEMRLFVTFKDRDVTPAVVQLLITESNTFIVAVAVNKLFFEEVTVEFTKFRIPVEVTFTPYFWI